MFKIHELLKATAGKLACGSPAEELGGVSIDSRSIRPRDAFIAIKGNNFDGHDFITEAIKKGAGCIIQERPLSRAEAAGHKEIISIEVKDTVRALGDIARYHRRRFDIPVVAVTGSNGKTTTKEMAGSILSVRFNVLKNEGTKNNHIGLPMALLGLGPDTDIAVLEIGTNHPGEVEYLARICLPNAGLITNIGPSHLEHFGSIKNVFREKYALIENLEKPYLGILNADDAFLRKHLLKSGRKPFLTGFGIKNKSDFFALGVKSCGRKMEFFLKKEKITLDTPGYCNVYNALAAICLGRVFGIEYKDIAKRLAGFEFPQGRLKFARFRQVDFIDDTYNSNPLSLGNALSALADFESKGRKILVMGDMLELGSRQELFHRQAGRRVKDACDIFVAVGKFSRSAAQSAKKSGFKAKNIFVCGSSTEARGVLFGQISPGPNDIVLVKGSRSMRMEEVFKEA